jgi:hypothetical protein
MPEDRLPHPSTRRFFKVILPLLVQEETSPYEKQSLADARLQPPLSLTHSLGFGSVQNARWILTYGCLWHNSNLAHFVERDLRRGTQVAAFNTD